MADQSKLLSAAERVCLLFRDVVTHVTGDQIEAAKALLQMTVAINELSIEVKKGRNLLEQLAKLKQEFMPADEQQTPVSVEKPQTPIAQMPTNIDPSKLVEQLMASLSLPKNPSIK
jgi:hypothetical protein